MSTPDAEPRNEGGSGHSTTRRDPTPDPTDPLPPKEAEDEVPRGAKSGLSGTGYGTAFTGIVAAAGAAYSRASAPWVVIVTIALGLGALALLTAGFSCRWPVWKTLGSAGAVSVAALSLAVIPGPEPTQPEPQVTSRATANPSPSVASGPTAPPVGVAKREPSMAQQIAKKGAKFSTEWWFPEETGQLSLPGADVWTDQEARRRWIRSHEGIDTSAYMYLTLQTDRTAVLQDLRLIDVSCKPQPTAGSVVIFGPPQGGDVVMFNYASFEVNDAGRATATYGLANPTATEGGVDGGAWSFPSGLEKDNPMVVEVFVRTANLCSWRVALEYDLDGSSYTQIIDDDGRAFQTVGDMKDVATNVYQSDDGHIFTRVS